MLVAGRSLDNSSSVFSVCSGGWEVWLPTERLLGHDSQGVAQPEVCHDTARSVYQSGRQVRLSHCYKSVSQVPGLSVG